jgi:chromosome segregation protein
LRNRLAALQSEIAQAETEAQSAADALDQSAKFFEQHQAEDRRARDALQSAFAALNDARETYTKQEKEATAITSKLAVLDDGLRQIHVDLAQIRSRASAIEDEQLAMPDIDTQRTAGADMRARLAEKRSLQAQYEGERERLAREQYLYEGRQKIIAEERGAWQSRLGNAAAQIESLSERITTIESQLAQLRYRPAELEIARAQLLTELSTAETRRKEAADRLIETEQRLSVVEQRLKQDETSLSDGRETRVRAEAAVQLAAEHFNTLRERMTEKLNCTPEELSGIAAFGENEMPDAFELEQALGRYLRERENMGPVNLRAEVETETLQGEIDKLQKEKDDLVAAIAKLRQGISQLNREARERLQNAFTLVNERFQVLFKRLFNGGKAHLELIDAEDPMEAGLEIFASPPGKKMQILSLLSGGERTLTALALIFAVFQTNPSPICVLDEAEAALDESNIDRFCMLVEDIARETGTRFLIITHQRLTMARMDRLYGVTMSEKGVSQLVSVDLAGAVAIRNGESVEAISPAEAALEEVKAA